MKRVAIVIILIFISVFVYSSYIERNLLRVKKHSISFSKNSNHILKLVQFSDTQLGDYYSLKQLEQAALKINTLNPDIVVFTGDLVDNAAVYKHLSSVSKVLARIKAKTGKYAIYGNHDYGGGAVRVYNKILAAGGFELLKNTSVLVKSNKRRIKIYGSDDALLGNIDVKKTMKHISENDLNVLLLHEPDRADLFKSYPLNLILSGHSHGGQVYIPFIGALKKTFMAEKYERGFYSLNNQKNTMIYVNTGLGNTKSRFRLLNIPEIALFNIHY